MKAISSIFSGDAIVASATPPGRSALAIIRGSGNGIIKIFQESLAMSVSMLDVDGNRAVVLDINIGDFCDRCIATVFRAPKSYTGEDMVEISVHGSSLIVRTVLDALVSGGARLAMPGEFTMRAVINAKMDLIEAESINAKIAAQTKRALDTASRTIQNAAEIEKVKETAYNILLELVASLEFPEDAPVDDTTMESWQRKIEESYSFVQRFMCKVCDARKLWTGITIVIAGETNAGKSTLFNRIVGTERAIVTPHPGTTRDIIEAVVEIVGIPVTIMDTAGIRESDHPIEAEGIRRAQDVTRTADIVLWVMDGSNPDAKMQCGEKIIPIINKSDIAVSENLRKLYPDALVISALKGDGLEMLLRRIESYMTDIPDDAVMISARIEDVMCKIEDELKIALDAAKKDFWDIVQISLERVHNYFMDIFSQGNDIDMYDEIFSKFCIGK
ncbi:tRNA uridine-5-carboxymethylaminomethyl(34) synthesis GTPase MnmE [bacterium]|nr:MAG: tRNA uridine-5-carboxymethylaminomethyl(34) synthesis GTPase MnmE [bacterium]